MYLVAGGALTGSQAAKKIKPDDINGLLTWKRETFLATERGRLRVHEFVIVTDIGAEVVELFSLQVLPSTWLVFVLVIFND